ncbi:MAG: hypothetical protein OXT09_00590, partial [Myxococcales bacterium]|nr:hypothetical protein [Myxococcales bacterium]
KVMSARGVERVFNLEVAGTNAYRVGRRGVLAHNQDGAGACSSEAPRTDVHHDIGYSDFPEGITPEQYEAQMALLTDESQAGRDELIVRLPEIVVKELVCADLDSCFVQIASMRFRVLSRSVRYYGEGLEPAVKHGLPYAPRVRARAVEDPVSHGFPYSFDDAVLATQPTVKSNGYKLYQLRGTMTGRVVTDPKTGVRSQTHKEGVFEIGVNKDGIIDHRFFRPDKK